MNETRLWQIGGRVQGVGYRPFVARLAARLSLSGWVRNRMGSVEVLARGAPDLLDDFATALIHAAPPLARPELLGVEASNETPEGFEIRDSVAGPAEIHLPPDSFCCPDCLAELADPGARRHRYPFINCTQCGPRYTIIRTLPYDRARTAMAGFPLCPDCDAEYHDITDRRFHAEPLACPACGPQIRMGDAVGEQALQAALALLRAGGILAMKGVGGYHLLCNAGDASAVARLRARKHRPAKPFAVMAPDMAALAACVAPTPGEEALLTGPARPILLLAKREGAPLAPDIAPGLGDLGVMLPPSPLHLLLAEGFGAPLVATSGNVSGEPICITESQAEERLGRIAEGFLHHDRPVLRPVDDPVFRPLGSAPRPLRHGRGTAPVELDLPFALDHPVLALGGQQKVTLTLAFGRRAVVSQHLGDMESAAAQDLLLRMAEDLQALYGIRAEEVIRDAHPGYATTRLAEGFGLPVTPVWHHHAHASALAGEHEAGDNEAGAPWLIFTWDGTGLGPDGTVWGGEALLGRPGAWTRAGTLRPFALPGGETVARAPWRSAAGLLWEAGADHHPPEDSTGLLHAAWARGLNAPRSSSAGRLFDAAAALTGLCRTASFEGQGAMVLEAACSGPADPVALPLSRKGDTYVTDWSPLLPVLQSDLPVGARAAIFHASLARTLCDQARAIARDHELLRIGLTGGVFQNRHLTRLILDELADEFDIHLPRLVPVNDGGLSFGQVIETQWRDPR